MNVDRIGLMEKITVLHTGIVRSRPRSYDNNREGGYGNNREGGLW